MATITEPVQTSRPLKGGGIWIEGCLVQPPAGISGPLVFGRDWLLEVVRSQNRHSYGFFWAPFAIVRNFPEIDGGLQGRFVGFSSPSRPPADWLTTSVMFDLGTAVLPRTPQEFIPLVSEPRSYICMEETAVSALSQKAKCSIAARFRTMLSIGDIADALGVSHAHLTRQFKRDFGLTPVAYLHRLRVSDAMNMLSRGESILETGYEVGFNQTARFYSAFRKVTGTSPAKCRRSMT